MTRRTSAASTTRRSTPARWRPATTSCRSPDTTARRARFPTPCAPRWPPTPPHRAHATTPHSRTGSAFPNDTAPAFTPPAPNGAVDTVLLMNPTRLAQTFGAGRAQQVIDALGPFMTAYQHAQLVSLDDAPMTALYDAWDHDPCSVDAANVIVKAIGQQLDALLAGNPALRFVVRRRCRRPGADGPRAGRRSHRERAGPGRRLRRGERDHVGAQRQLRAHRRRVLAAAPARGGRARSLRSRPASRPARRNTGAAGQGADRLHGRARSAALVGDQPGDGLRLPEGRRPGGRGRVQQWRPQPHVLDQRHLDPRRPGQGVDGCRPRRRGVEPRESGPRDRLGERALRRAEHPPRDREHESRPVGAVHRRRRRSGGEPRRREDLAGTADVQHRLSLGPEPARRRVRCQCEHERLGRLHGIAGRAVGCEHRVRLRRHRHGGIVGEAHGPARRSTRPLADDR